MKIQLASDLHLEMLWDRSMVNQVLPLHDITGEVLILAGDICKQPGDLDYLRGLHIPVIYVLGNHEYYGFNFSERLAELKVYFHNTNIHVLDNEIMLLNGVWFVCSTMWTDLDNGVGARMVKQCMNDLYVIKEMTIVRWLAAHARAREFLGTALEQLCNGMNKVVVVTHHAPSFESEKRHFGSPLSGGFCAHMDDVIEKYQPNLWVHGHTHDTCDYHRGKTRIISNQKGYRGEESVCPFNSELVVEI